MATSQKNPLHKIFHRHNLKVGSQITIIDSLISVKYVYTLYVHVYILYICIHTYMYEFLVRQRLHHFENVVPAYLVVFIAALEMPDVIH